MLGQNWIDKHNNKWIWPWWCLASFWLHYLFLCGWGKSLNHPRDVFQLFNTVFHTHQSHQHWKATQQRWTFTLMDLIHVQTRWLWKKHHHILEFPILNPLALCWNCLRFFLQSIIISRLSSSFWNHNLFTKNRVVKLKKGPTIKIKSFGKSQLQSVKTRGLCLNYIVTKLWKTFFTDLTLASEDNTCFIAWTFFSGIWLYIKMEVVLTCNCDTHLISSFWLFWF